MNKIKKSIIVTLALVSLLVGTHTTQAQNPDVYCDSAVIYGTVQPNGREVDAWFEWGTNRSTVQNGGGSKVGNFSISRNAREETVSYKLKNLNEKTAYYYRLVIKLDGEVWPATTETFTTTSCAVEPPLPPVTPDPTLNLSANPTRVPYKGSSTITWEAKNSSSCVANGGISGWNGNKSTAGSFFANYLTNTTTFHLSCSNSEGKSISKNVTVNVDSLPPVTPSPTVNISASKTNVSYNGESIISWSSENSDYCTASGGTNGWAGRKNTSGNFSSGPLTSDTTFYINCTGNGGTTQSKSVKITVGEQSLPISVRLSADEDSLSYNQSTIVRWYPSSNVTSCVGTGGSVGWAGSKSASNGSFNTGRLVKDTVFGITCYNIKNESTKDTITIKVSDDIITDPVITGSLTLYPTSCNIKEGENTCEINATWVTKVANNVTLLNRNKNKVLSYETQRSSYNPLLVQVSYPSTTFDLKNNSIILDSEVATAYCESGTYWNGSICTKGTSQSVDVKISANPTNITSGNSTNISWYSQGAITSGTACTATGGANGWAGNKGTSGTTNSGPLYNTTTFNITCYGSQGQSDSDSVTVYVNNDNTDDKIPTVNTRSATDIDEDSATLRGFVDSNGGNNTRAWFEWGTSSNSYPNQTNSVNYGSTNGTNFESTIRGLSSNRTYYFRAIAQSSNGDIVYGSRQSFTTEDDYYNDDDDDNDYDRPDVNTNSATSVTDSRAVLNGFVDPNDKSTTTWFEWGTSYNNLNRTTSRDSQGTRRDDFEESIYGLSPNTIYYFRAMARNSEGTSQGNILSFITSGGGGGYYPIPTPLPPIDPCAYGNCAPNVITTLATNITESGARVNGMSTSTGTAYTSGYFEYGTTYSLGYTTAQRNVTSSSTVPFSETLTNLAPNTTYYYRAVATNQYGTARGSIFTFRTGSMIVYTNTSTGTNTVYRNTTVVSNTTTSVGNSRPSLVMLTVSGNDETVRQGELVDYIITYENISTKDLRDVILRIGVPGEFEFVDTSKGSYSEKDNTIVVNIGDLYPREQGSVRITLMVDINANIGAMVVIPANLAYTITETKEQEEVFAYAQNIIGAQRLGLGASAIFGVGFLPSTLLGWLLLILLLLLLVASIRWLYDRSGRNQVSPQVPPPVYPTH